MLSVSLALLASLVALPVVSLAQDAQGLSDPNVVMIVPDAIGIRTYGTAAKTFLTLSPSDFRPERSTLMYQLNSTVGVGQTMSRTGGPTSFSFKAPLHLPEGALVTEVGFVFCDTSPTGFFTSELVIQPRMGNTTGQNLIASNDFETPGCVDQTATLSPPIQIDNGANYYEVAFYLSTGDTTIQFASARVGYQLQVSAPGAQIFDDVPPSHPFFQFIQALAAAGITGGCSASPPLYCPDNPLTRGQMAVFLSRALGLHFAP